MVKHGYAPEWSYQETKENILSIEDPETKYFAGITYALGARLNEARHLCPKDISIVKNNDGEDRLLISLLTLKNDNIERRNIPLNPTMEKEYANLFFGIINAYKPDEKPFHNNTAINGVGLNQRTYQRRIKKYLDIHVHALRHLRVHHIDDKEIPGMKGLTPRQFKDLFGWALIETSSSYQSRTRGRDLTELF